CSTVATVCFINALRLTAVADVMVIGAAAPLAAAAIDWLVTRRRERASTLLAALVALAGVMLMVGTSGSRHQLVGDALAVVMAVLLAAMMVIIRARRDTDLLPAPCLSAFLCALVVLPAAQPGAPGLRDGILLLLFGVLQFGLGLVLLTLGSRRVSAARSA